MKLCRLLFRKFGESLYSVIINNQQRSFLLKQNYIKPL